MTVLSKDELNEFANALQLSITSKITGIKRIKDDVVEIQFARSALKDSHLRKFVDLVKGTFRQSGKTLSIKDAPNIDWPKLISFLFVTRLADENITALRRMDSKYEFITGDRGLERPQVNIDNIMSASDFVFSVVKSKRMTLRSLSEKTGLTQASLSKFKAGGDVRLSNLIKISKALSLQLKLE